MALSAASFSATWPTSRPVRDRQAARTGRPCVFQAMQAMTQDMLLLKKRRGKLKAATYWQRAECIDHRLEDSAKQRWDEREADRLKARLNRHRTRLTTIQHKRSGQHEKRGGAR